VPTHIPHPTIIPASGNAPKIIREFIGRVTTQSAEVSIAQMSSPSGWEEPGQRPEFDEYTVVLRGSLRVEFAGGGSLDVRAGEGVIVHRGEWVRYSTPGAEGADYVAICIPAFSPSTVHRDPPA
jgi:mannose-6-phosphate isomerase-like protein (cupin superfamily)